MSAEVIPLPGVTVMVDGEPYVPHSCVIEELQELLEMAKSGQLRSFIIVGEVANGPPVQSFILCEANLHVLNSVLSLAQETVKGRLLEGVGIREAPPLETS